MAALLLVPLIAIKTMRWQTILASQAIAYRFWPALLAYFASLFIGFLTPARLGEFTKSIYVRQDCKAPLGVAISSVLADRLFDLFVIILVSVLALINLEQPALEWSVLIAVVLLFCLPLFLFLNSPTYSRIQQLGQRMGSLGKKIFAENGWLADVRHSLLQLKKPTLVTSVVLTVLAYGIYFLQAYLLSKALCMPLSLWQASMAVALGGLVTLMPISISGLGTREAVMAAYLTAWDVPLETGVSLSFLVLVTFYLFGGLLGGIAWWIKPLHYPWGVTLT